MQDRFDGLKCQECDGPTTNIPEKEKQLCYDCGAECYINSSGAISTADELWEKGLYRRNSGDIIDAIATIEASLEIRKKFMYKFNQTIAITYDFLGKLYAEKGQFFVQSNEEQRNI